MASPISPPIFVYFILIRLDIYLGCGTLFVFSEPPRLDVTPAVAPAPSVRAGRNVVVGGGGVAPFVVVVVVLVVITRRLDCCVVVDLARHWEIPAVKSTLQIIKPSSFGIVSGSEYTKSSE